MRRQGKDEEALKEFQNAYSSSPSKRSIAQVGLAEQALGRWPEAETHLLLALDDAADPWIKKNEAALKKSLAEIQRHLGSLEIIGPAGAVVVVNGQTLGQLPFAKPARVPIGVLNVEVRKERYLPSTRPVSVSMGMLARESIGLQMEPAPMPRQGGGASRASESTAAPGATAPSQTDPPSSEQAADTVVGQTETRSWRRPAAWIAAAGSALAVGGGAVALVLRNGKIHDANNLSCNVGNGTVAPVDPANASRCLDFANSASRLGVSAVILFSVAGALAIGSGILFFTAPSARSVPSNTIACGPSLFTPGGSCLVTF